MSDESDVAFLITAEPTGANNPPAPTSWQEEEITLEGGQKVKIIRVYTTTGDLGFVAWLLEATSTPQTANAAI